MLADIETKVRDNFAKAFEQSLGEELPNEEDDDEYVTLASVEDSEEDR